MPELPASVRLALWATASAAGTVSVPDAVAAATPDLDVDAGAAERRIALWHDLGETVVMVSLPAPGDLVGLPRGDAAFMGEVIDAGECAWSPLVGGALVPEFVTFGSPGDEGHLVRWQEHACTPPTPTRAHLPDLERDLRELTLHTTRAVEDLDAAPWRAGLRELADERLHAGRWGLPVGVDERAVRLLTQASMMETIAATAAETLHEAPTTAAFATRSDLLRELRTAARRAVCAAANEAATSLAAQGRTSR